MRIRAPAKVNLKLRVVGKRRDGYHLIDTIIAPVHGSECLPSLFVDEPIRIN